MKVALRLAGMGRQETPQAMKTIQITWPAAVGTKRTLANVIL